MANRNDSFFDNLKKLFSRQSITKIDRNGNRKVVDINDSQSNTNFVNLRDRYTKLQRSYYEQQGGSQSMAYQQVRRELFRDYDAMDNDPIISSALDIYSDESTTKDEYGNVLTIKSSNHKIKTLLTNLFYDVMNIEFNLWPWVRNMTKYGDFYLTLEIAPNKGIINVRPYSVYNVERLENTDPKNPTYVKFKVEMDEIGKKEYENYEMAHFRLLSDTNFLPYGKSMIENARRLWKQLSLMEDAMLIHRIMRAPEKRIFKIDIGNIPPTEVDNYMQKIINKMKKTPFVDKNTGDYNLKYNIQNLTEDYFLPVRGSDSGTSIDNLGGLEYSAIDDIEYLRGKLFAALKVPKAYLSYDETINGKATLAAEDVRFARTIERIQRTIVSELQKIAIVHLAAYGIDDEQLVNFELSLTNSSTIYEQEKINLWSEKIKLASDIRDSNMLSSDWIYTNVFGLSRDQVEIEKAKVILDLKQRYRHSSIVEQGEDPAAIKKPMPKPAPVPTPQPEPEPEEDEEETKTPEGEDTEEETPEQGEEESTEDDEEKITDGYIFKKKDMGGRPKEGNTYGKDKHPYGRDPLGHKENMKAMAREAVSGMGTKRKTKTQLNEDDLKKTIVKSMLDESNIYTNI
jgi:Bacteriophage T4-like portal protein (Gp20)